MPAILAALRIRNFALVDELSWEPAAGLVAITGETGAGKSILIGALKLVLGERADRSLIRAGADACSVEAVFRLGDTAAMDRELAGQGIDPCEEGQLLLKRTFSLSGANRQFVNCSPTTLAALKAIGEGLVDLHGPHDHQSLFSPDCQRDLLDAFAGCEPAAAEHRERFRGWQKLEAERRELSGGEAGLERELELLRHQVAEIEAAAVDPAEEEPLQARYRLCANARRLLELCGQALRRLSEDEDSALGRLSEVLRAWRELERLDPELAPHLRRHEEAAELLAENARALQAYADALETDPAAARALEERVNLLENLKRKYGPALADVVAAGERAAERLRRLENRGEELARLDEAIGTAKAELAAVAARLTAARQVAAPKLAEAARGHLADLGFRRAGFEVALRPVPEPRASGAESVEFLFAPNPGEPERALRAIASSGEISRVMLALKTALAGQDAIPLMVFDEIDANVGGEIAHAVGRKMRALGQRHQVLAITHLPQVAACAETHFVVEKEVRDDRSITRLRPVDGPEREGELARMLGGRSATALEHARALLRGADNPPAAGADPARARKDSPKKRG